MTDKLIMLRINRALKPLRHSGNRYDVRGGSGSYVVTYPKYLTGEHCAALLVNAGLVVEHRNDHIAILGLCPTGRSKAAQSRAKANKAAAKAADKRPRYGGLEDKESEAARGVNQAASGDPSNGDA